MEGKTINITISESFKDFVLDWDYSTYLLLGGYGSGKSYAIAQKLVLKCLQEKRKVLVCRNVYETIKDSCYALFKDILEDLNGFGIRSTLSPLAIYFPNGSQIIFRGMDNPEKLKSIHGVSIVWIEEASEIRFSAYEELLGRIREKDSTNHFILSCNPVGKENWIYTTFFKRLDDEGKEMVVLDEEKLYQRKVIVKGRTYYHHSLPEENPFIPDSYIHRLDELKTIDSYLYRVARLGRFGTTGLRVLPNFEVATNPREFKKQVKSINRNFHFVGFDFGFETSYNAIVKCCVDDKEKVLYVYDEIYLNHITDDKFANLPEMLELKEEERLIIADSAEPKTIQFYRQQGFKMKPCKKYVGSRLSNTRKMKRFKKIICSPKCKNTIRELIDLTYKKDNKGNVIYDEFNIDPHTFSALWYALDNYTVADYKLRGFNSFR